QAVRDVPPPQGSVHPPDTVPPPCDASLQCRRNQRSVLHSYRCLSLREAPQVRFWSEDKCTLAVHPMCSDYPGTRARPPPILFPANSPKSPRFPKYFPRKLYLSIHFSGQSKRSVAEAILLQRQTAAFFPATPFADARQKRQAGGGSSRSQANAV